MKKSIGYHTRSYANNTTKIVGGSFGGDVSIDTANRLLSNHGYTVAIKQSGNPVFVDKNGREVTLYFTINPRDTEIGKLAIAEYNSKQKYQQDIEDEMDDEINSLMEGLSREEIIARLK